MTPRRALSIALAALVALTIGAPASPVRADVLAAVAPGSASDVRTAVLVGPSGQVWEPDGQDTWTRRIAGGVAADVRGAALIGSALVVAGKSTPLYRRNGERWAPMRLGERGRTLVGQGPRPAVAIGRLVFVWTGTSWKRVGRAAQVVTALWAASETKVVIATEAGVFRLAGGAFNLVGLPPGPVIGLGGASSAWAITAAGEAIEVATRRVHHPTVGGQPLTVALLAAAGDSVWALGTTPAGPALARLRKGVWAEVAAPPIPPDDAPVALLADTAGALLVATRAGAVVLGGPDGTWTAAARGEALPAGVAGPGPARTR